MKVQAMNKVGTIIMYQSINFFNIYLKKSVKKQKFCVGIQFPISDFLIFFLIELAQKPDLIHKNGCPFWIQRGQVILNQLRNLKQLSKMFFFVDQCNYSIVGLRLFC